jgi:hypothetical protein
MSSAFTDQAFQQLLFENFKRTESFKGWVKSVREEERHIARRLSVEAQAEDTERFMPQTE